MECCVSFSHRQPALTKVNGQVAGYVETFDTGTNFSFATVRDAGHMMPRYKPMQALHLIRRYLANQPL